MTFTHFINCCRKNLVLWKTIVFVTQNGRETCCIAPLLSISLGVRTLPFFCQFFFPIYLTTKFVTSTKVRILKPPEGILVHLDNILKVELLIMGLYPLPNSPSPQHPQYHYLTSIPTHTLGYDTHRQAYMGCRINTRLLLVEFVVCSYNVIIKQVLKIMPDRWVFISPWIVCSFHQAQPWVS